MKQCIFIVWLLILFSGCQSQRMVVSDAEKAAFETTNGDPVTIENEELEYEITIIDPGFYSWLYSIAHPRGYYSQSFLENRNRIMVMEWNQRVTQPQFYDSNLYEMQINYEQGVDYGYEVNYQLYNYLIYFQRKYNQRLGPWLPRI
ncbi:DUF6146 family protein [Imtechella halotolerans]|nr:DUF6146 family protein [Imtechella halotolerans]WMQ64353.1 DUF6146 family protein [Imtechella halotolerans]